METRILKIEDVPRDLAALIHRMRRRGDCMVIKDATAPVAYLNLALRPDIKRPTPEEAGVHPEPQVVYNRRTGLPEETARLGARMITSEEIREFQDCGCGW